MIRFVVILLCALSIVEARAQQQDSYELWPELDVYYRFSSTERLYFLIAPTRERDVGMRDVQVGANLDVGLTPFIRGMTDSTLNEAAGFRYLRLRTGVRYFFGVDPETPYQEWRGVIEITPLYPIGNIGTIYFRNRLDLRWVSGEFSYRYRGRLQFDKQFDPFGTGNVSISPLVSAELSLDNRFSGIARMRYQAGVSIGLTGMIAVEPILNYQQNFYPTEQSIFAIGIGVVFYL